MPLNQFDADLLKEITTDANARLRARSNDEYARAVGRDGRRVRGTIGRLRMRNLITLDRTSKGQSRRFGVKRAGFLIWTEWSLTGNPSAEARGKTTTIRCLCCPESFPSENVKTHRICPKCTAINSGMAGAGRCVEIHA